ncbi:hypothetical protein [Amycolatopsis suaedae]|uniref:ANTAR domain-containing protein n=1 Tax=Amycolatopsis suaedae TaxID=2510978 RepID=A0A4Q7J935_9PSEU|nr:hypothetical protein [Amycolatopsis suaedae]RZQ64251.1 hypothetical protein EWH70_09730 [Amycolatopsis suaedae]
MNGLPQGDNGFHVAPDQVTAHAQRVERTHEVLDQALQAANQRMGYEAFGLLGLAFAWRCNETMEGMTEALRTAIDTSNYHVSAVRKWAEVKRVDEESIGTLLGKIGPK